jgi:hypothetical protein
LFITPLLGINVLYGGSSAFVEAVRGNDDISRVFAAFLEVGPLSGWRVYAVFSTFTLLSAAAYFTDLTPENRLRVSAFYWLCGAILPLLFIVWEPYWLMSVVPPTVLTTMLCRNPERFFRLDILGMFSYVAVLALGWQNDTDAVLFRGEIVGLHFNNTYLMARLFRWFGTNSVNVFLSVFWAYMASQLIFKSSLVRWPASEEQDPIRNYGVIRQRLYLGLLTFLAPVSFAIYKDQIGDELVVQNLVVDDYFSLKTGDRLEQSFVAEGSFLKHVSLSVATLGKRTTGILAVEILDGGNSVIGRTATRINDMDEIPWQDFRFEGIHTKSGEPYRIRLTCAAGELSDVSPAACNGGCGVVWTAAVRDTYPKGAAIVNGIPLNADFGFRVFFRK